MHAFLPREADGYRAEETWDTLGMRQPAATTRYLKAPSYPTGILPQGPGWSVRPVVLGLFDHFLPGLSAVYYGLARRATDLALASVRGRASLGLARPVAFHSEVQHLAAENDARARRDGRPPLTHRQ
jgi:alkylation response protein AidB-like acyl-CoA dehydrogenase